MKNYMDEHDRLTAHITRIEAIAKTVELNFLDGGDTYHMIDEGKVATLVWQIEDNLKRIHESAEHLYAEWKKVAMPDFVHEV